MTNVPKELEGHFQKTLVALRDADTLKALSLASVESLDVRLLLFLDVFTPISIQNQSSLFRF